MKPSISFEFFPTKSPEAEAAFYQAAADLRGLGPKFMTVTYGAGGSTKDKTLEITSKLAKEPVPIASHLTFLTTERDQLEVYLDALWENNVRHIIALRGDLPKGKSFDDFKGAQYFKYTSDFVEHLKRKNNFEISVAAYPEKHPDAPSLAADIEALRKKCDAGADRAITQFFFDNDKYYAFLEACAKAGITTPICPGLVPVHDFKSLVRFAANCQAQVPDWVHTKFEKVLDKPDEARKIATEMLVKQAEDLARQGVGHIHFYCLNKAGITTEACKAIGY